MAAGDDQNADHGTGGCPRRAPAASRPELLELLEVCRRCVNPKGADAISPSRPDKQVLPRVYRCNSEADACLKVGETIHYLYPGTIVGRADGYCSVVVRNFQ